jgi:hypothetical protein
MVLLIASPAFQAQTREKHLTEGGAGPLFSRSAFAHGYRHGYEEGYHSGNLDVNMGRLAQNRKTLLHGVKYGFSPGFGSRRSFEAGFEAGMIAGYSDGYVGRTFRAIGSVRAIAFALEGSPQPSDSASLSFDQGLAFGYREAFANGGSPAASGLPLDFHSIGCGQFPLQVAPDQDLIAQSSYCDGYRRGFVLGHADAQALGADQAALEASK